MRYQPDQTTDYDTRLDASYEITDALWQTMQEQAHLVVYMVQADRLEDAQLLTDDYFTALAQWTAVVKWRHDTDVFDQEA